MQKIKHFLNVVFNALTEMRKISAASALARMGRYNEAKEALL